MFRQEAFDKVFYWSTVVPCTYRGRHIPICQELELDHTKLPWPLLSLTSSNLPEQSARQQIKELVDHFIHCIFFYLFNFRLRFSLCFEGRQRLDVHKDIRLPIDPEDGAHGPEHPTLWETQGSIYH